MPPRDILPNPRILSFDRKNIFLNQKFKNQETTFDTDLTTKQKTHYRSQWAWSDQGLDLEIRFKTSTATHKKKYVFDLEPLVINNNFRIKEFIRNIVKSFTDMSHPLCVLTTINRPQRPSTLPADLIRTGKFCKSARLRH